MRTKMWHDHQNNPEEREQDAKGVGMHQVFYNVTGKEELPFQPTYHISNLKELMQIL